LFPSKRNDEGRVEIIADWENTAINGVQWSGGDIKAIVTEEDAKKAVAETLDFKRKKAV
jgi:hypothetical protein